MKHKLIGTLFLISVFLIQVGTVSAQEIDLSETPDTPTPAPVEYQLPYPGVLPGHFLYTLKDMRDTIISFMISNPIKKAQFDILQSDKRFETAFVLISKDKSKLDKTKETLVKAQNYFDEALEKTAAAQKEGMDVHDLLRVLVLAEPKHMEILKDIKQNVGSHDKQFADEEKREKEFAKRLKQLRP